MTDENMAEPIFDMSSLKPTFDFSENWFELVRPDWESLAQPVSRNENGAPRKIRILEIGSFEGASTTWILQNMMDHPESMLVAIDSFEGGMEHQGVNNVLAKDLGTLDYNLPTLETRFRANVSKCKHAEKLRIMKAPSSQALLHLRQDQAVFDFIYIDGSHVAFDVLSDAVLSWPMLEVGGVLVFDDSRWKGYLEDCYNPRVAVMSFLQCVKQEASIKETESQVWMTKVPCVVKPTPNPDPALYYWDDDYLRYTSYP